MQRRFSSELTNHIDQHVIVRGWLHTLRALGKLSFLILRDMEGLIQIVIQDKTQIQQVAHLQPGSVLHIKGTVIASSQAGLKVELIDPQITVEVPIHEVPLIEYYKPEIPSELDFILDHRAIALRNAQLQAVFKCQAEIAHAYRSYMYGHVRAVEYFAPNLIGTSSEGGAEFFNVDYFGYPATLAQSSQLYKQIMVGVNERVFALMPFFRAEPSHTNRHLAEGKQFEFEMGFFNHWHELMDIQEGCIKYILKHLHACCSKELARLDHHIIQAPEEVPFPRITFEQAQQIYFERTGIDQRHEPDLSPAAERELCAYAREKFGTDLVFITDWLTEKRPFYAFPKEDHPRLTNTFDLLCAGTEITSGGQRRHTYESMVEGIHSKGMDPNSFTDYLSIFKYGMPPHGGFGMGLERLTMTILKLKNIRETSLFPSDAKRIAGTRIKGKIFFGEENIRNEMIRLLRHHDMDFEHLVHQPTPRAEDTASAPLLFQQISIKAIILRGKNSKKNYQFNLPTHLKLDMKMVTELVQERCEFEDPQIILDRFGLVIGSIPPWGNLLNLDTFFDQTLQAASSVSFNCGLATESIIMQSADLIALVQPTFGSFSKE